MLINRIRNTYRELTGQFTPLEAVTTVAVRQPAANAGSYEKANVQARRQRRMRRLERRSAHNINGWTVRTW